ncbi:uncharacterized protein F4822DRAFT_426355 [Hypoxylon trugodes]|uniref:uncharacterized protein n=1 Tax=Hypoxylon trugodes TaxID=326681 RepID=UPI00219227B0|nr:uncharacterized protein F4822DRAFT_426355 [Hypoxylon trugodes]KAI1390507.1 hypothetical protein F4822DRAFT_426355 [Hypoxylon trugodes]
MPERVALEDVSNRANQLPATAASDKLSSNNAARNAMGLTFEEYKTMTLQQYTEANSFGPNAVPGGAKRTKSAATSGPSSSKKRKAELSLEDEIAAYKQNLDDIISPDDFEYEPKPSCQAVRNRINKLPDADIMRKTGFAQAIGGRNSNTNSLNNFLKQSRTYEECNNSIYSNTKKRQTQQAEASTSSNTGSSAPKAAKVASLPDISNIHLDGEETDSVSVYDSCDEIRRKVNAHLKLPNVTQAQFCRDLYAQLHATTIKGIQSKQLADFRAGKRAKTGAKSTVFYAAYVYFEKLRVAQNKPKTKHREDMEDIWELKGGFDRETDHRTMYLGAADGGELHFDKYGLRYRG